MGILTLRTARNTTIDNIDVQATPSLAGYWKGNEVTGLVINDYSKYGNNLTVFQQPANGTDSNRDKVFSHNPGWASFIIDTGAEVDATGTRLDSGTKIVVFGAELVHAPKAGSSFQGLWDADMGTAHNVADGSNYNGYMLGGQTNEFYARVNGLDSGDNAITSRPNDDGTVYSQNTRVSLATGFIPSGRVVCARNSETPKIETAVASTMVKLPAPQDGKFRLFGAQGFNFISVRNYFVWVFDAEPPLFNSTIEWMGHNPGKVPTWWEGL